VEATQHLHYALDLIRQGGVSAGAAICPGTPVSALADVAAAGVLDLALCMSVNPGWGNQSLIPHSFAKLQMLRAAMPAGIAVEVDGGINPQSARTVAESGANLLVAGSAVFGAADPAAAFAAVTAAAWPA
jgi:ribulose-phosphate 3-epimerase